MSKVTPVYGTVEDGSIRVDLLVCLESKIVFSHQILQTLYL